MGNKIGINGWEVKGVPFSGIETGLYVVANLSKYGLWYYGAYSSEEKALAVADEYNLFYCGKV